MSEAETDPLRPQAQDESRHPADADPWWNESWYADAVSEDRRTGVYLRLGHVPNQPGGLYSVAVVEPDGSATMLIDDTAPEPDEDGAALTVSGSSYTGTQEVVEPLQEFRMTCSGTAQRFADPAAVLRDQTGTARELGVDLTWRTDGIGYQWQISTRYEIPCAVSGTITLDGQETQFSGPGQRDHSWGARDWWSNEWMWSAFHLDDGTRVHAVTIPAFDGLAMGYWQTGGDFHEINEGRSAFEPGDDGIPTRCTIDISGFPETTATPLVSAPLKLVADDGRVTHFVRAMARFEVADGRQGHGWIEWNIVQ